MAILLSVMIAVPPSYSVASSSERAAAAEIEQSRTNRRLATELAETLAPLIQRSALATTVAESQIRLGSRPGTAGQHHTRLDETTREIGRARVVLANLPHPSAAHTSRATRISDAQAAIETLYKANTATALLVSEWKAEQERLAAAAAAAAAAATSRPTLAFRATVHPPKPPAPAVLHTFTIFVRTSVNAGFADSSSPGGLYNGQDEVNRGGQVAVNWPRWGTFVSAHNSNDSRALQMQNGDIVQLSGAISGTFRVIGAAVIHKGDGPDQALRLPTRLFMQTCFFGSGNMRLVGLAAA